MTPLDHQSYYDFISHLKVAFQAGETFNSVVSHFYSWKEKGKESDDNFGDELQVLAHKVIRVKPSWRSQANEVPKPNLQII